MPVGRLDADRVGEARGPARGRPGPRRGPVADADDLELLGEALGDPDHHVGDQGAGQPVQGPVPALVVGPLTTSTSPSWATVIPGQSALQRALGPLHGDRVAASVTVDARGHGDGGTADARHQASLRRRAIVRLARRRDRSALTRHSRAPRRRRGACARLTVGHQALAGREDRHAEAAEHAGHACRPAA